MHYIAHDMATLSHQTLKTYREAKHVSFAHQTENSLHVFDKEGVYQAPISTGTCNDL